MEALIRKSLEKVISQFEWNFFNLDEFDKIISAINALSLNYSMKGKMGVGVFASPRKGCWFIFWLSVLGNVSGLEQR